MKEKALKALSIGNSFSADTMEHLPTIARSLGYKKMFFGNLYIGGCSIALHHRNLTEGIGDYKLYTSSGDGWTEAPGYKIGDAVKMEDWDFISIQHGSKNGSRYSNTECYDLLPDLVNKVKALAPKNAKILFNLAWAAEPYSNRQEITEWNGNKELLFKRMCEITESIVEKQSGVDFVCPTGTAIMNACESEMRNDLYRDGFHLSYDKGRFIAALAFFAKLTGEDVDALKLSVEYFSDHEMQIAKQSVKNAIINPYQITKMN